MIFWFVSIVTSVWSKVVSIAEGLYARFSAAAVFLGPYKAGSFFFVDICNKNLDTFGNNHYYAQVCVDLSVGFSRFVFVQCC